MRRSANFDKPTEALSYCTTDGSTCISIDLSTVTSTPACDFSSNTYTECCEGVNAGNCTRHYRQASEAEKTKTMSAFAPNFSMTESPSGFTIEGDKRPVCWFSTNADDAFLYAIGGDPKDSSTLVEWMEGKLNGKEMDNNDTIDIRFHCGTAELEGRVSVFTGRTQVKAGETGDAAATTISELVDEAFNDKGFQQFQYTWNSPSAMIRKTENPNAVGEKVGVTYDSTAEEAAEAEAAEAERPISAYTHLTAGGNCWSNYWTDSSRSNRPLAGLTSLDGCANTCTQQGANCHGFQVYNEESDGSLSSCYVINPRNGATQIDGSLCGDHTNENGTRHSYYKRNTT